MGVGQERLTHVLESQCTSIFTVESHCVEDFSELDTEMWSIIHSICVATSSRRSCPEHLLFNVNIYYFKLLLKVTM